MEKNREKGEERGRRIAGKAGGGKSKVRI